MQYGIKARREQCGMTQEELSKRSKVSRAIISRLESGEPTSTRTDTLFRIADALECKVSDIFLP